MFNRKTIEQNDTKWDPTLLECPAGCTNADGKAWPGVMELPPSTGYGQIIQEDLGMLSSDVPDYLADNLSNSPNSQMIVYIYLSLSLSLQSLLNEFSEAKGE